MEHNGVSSFFHLLRLGVARLAKSGDKLAGAKKFPFYRYDSTGRVVHIGPEGDVLENDSAFQITTAHYKQSLKSL